MDQDPLAAHPRPRWVDVPLGLGVTSDLDSAHVPWVDRSEVVDDERRAAGRLDVAELACRPQRGAADRDLARPLVDEEANGDDLRRMLPVDGREPAERLVA